MTKRLYFEDCYTKEWETQIEKARRKKVVLQETAFYPEGGGQPTDKGVLRTDDRQFQVKKAKKKGNEIWHYVDSPGLTKGTKIKAKIDWDRRYKHMRMHTAQHILSAILLDHYNATTAGNQIHAEYSRVDFNPFEPTKEDLGFIVNEFNGLIDQAREVKKYIVDREKVPEIVDDPRRLRLFKRIPKAVKRIRIVEIEELDKDPCAGTHVRNTKEVGYINIRGTENKGKNTTRIIYGLQ